MIISDFLLDPSCPGEHSSASFLMRYFIPHMFHNVVNMKSTFLRNSPRPPPPSTQKNYIKKMHSIIFLEMETSSSSDEDSMRVKRKLKSPGHKKVKWVERGRKSKKLGLWEAIRIGNTVY